MLMCQKCESGWTISGTTFHPKRFLQTRYYNEIPTTTHRKKVHRISALCCQHTADKDTFRERSSRNKSSLSAYCRDAHLN